MAQNETADILIIGSGASGGVFAWHLSKLPGIKIVCLEQGTWSAPVAGVPQSQKHPEADAQRQRLTTPPDKKEHVRYWRDGYPYDHSDSYWTPVLGNMVGGASVHYGAVWNRYHPADFVAHSLDGIGDDWPLSYWDLEPYYDMLDNTVGVNGVLGDPSLPPIKARRMKTYPLSQSAEILARGFRKMGWHWWPTTTATITEPIAGRQPCPENCEACDGGCPREAKNSSDVVFWPEALRNGVVLKTKARVREITVNRKGLADGALYYDENGQLTEQKARMVVVAANGLGTPRLLLNSKSNRFPDGLANSSGLVGRNLMAHPMYSISALFENEDTAPRRYASTGLVSSQFCETDPGKRGFARGFWYLAGGFSGPVRAALGEPPTARAMVVPASMKVKREGPIQWGRLHHAAFQEVYKHTVGTSILFEEIPQETNYLELDSSITDEVGVPGIKLHFKRSENLERMIKFAVDRTTDAMMAAGASGVPRAAPLAEGGAYHLMGTAKMGNDPSKSVVNKWGQAHDVRNLFVIDGSIFVSAGAAVVTSTLQTLALRIADYVKTNSKDLLKG
ncbi:MAG: GMC family oxidoreductase [Acidimicrobiia bacterium]|nr:GMC family oxidoreductase [Acidimicrobiia bacterium]